MTQPEFDKILHRYLHDQCSEEERILVEDWFESLQREDVFIAAERETKAKDNSWSVLNKKYQIKGTQGRRGNWDIAKIAGAILVLAVSAFALIKYTGRVLPEGTLAWESAVTSDLLSITNTQDKPIKIALRDGSSVMLHTGSELRYPKKFGDTREVYLSGEGFFDIAKDPAHPFLVHANEITTKVLGTSFLVKAYMERKEIIVAVSTGRVSVSARPKTSDTPTQEVVLTPNQQVVYHRAEDTVEKQLVEKPKVLIKEPSMDLVYADASVVKVFEVLEKMYGVQIQFDENALANCHITTDMTDEGLFERLDVICHVLGARYSVENTVIVVDAKGCSN